MFTCMATRACHLELVQDVTTSAFIQAFLRFINRRGMNTRVIHSDNGSNFQGAEKEFKKLAALMKDSTDEIEEKLCPSGSVIPSFHMVLSL